MYQEVLHNTQVLENTKIAEKRYNYSYFSEIYEKKFVSNFSDKTKVLRITVTCCYFCAYSTGSNLYQPGTTSPLLRS